MKRREFLQTTAAVGGLGAASAATGCATLGGPARAPRLDPARMQGHITRLDDALVGIEHDMVIPGPADPERERAVRDALSTLVRVGAFIDLEPEDQAHPGMQARMREAMPQMDRALRGSLERIERMTPTERADLQRTLRENPGVLDDIGAYVDRHAAHADMPLTQRTRWRTLLKRIGPRMRQSLDMTLDAYGRKAHTLMARVGSEAEMERTLVGRLGQEAYAERLRRMEAATQGWEALGVSASTGSAAVTANDTSTGAPRERYSYETFSASLITLGVGAAMTLVGQIILATGVAEGMGLLLGVTVGPIVIGAALIWLLVDALIYAVRD